MSKEQAWSDKDRYEDPTHYINWLDNQFAKDQFVTFLILTIYQNHFPYEVYRSTLVVGFVFLLISWQHFKNEAVCLWYWHSNKLGVGVETIRLWQEKREGKSAHSSVQTADRILERVFPEEWE